MANALAGNAPADYAGPLWLDSGGYQVLRRGIKVEVEEVAERFRSMPADRYFSLDVPPAPQDPPEVARRKFEESYRNWLALREAVSGVAPVLHVYRDVGLMLEYLERYLDAPALAIGAAVPYVLATRGAKGGLRLVAQAVAEVRRRYGGWLHVFGLGSPSLVPLLAQLGVDSTDSATWALKAAYGKVLMPCGGERHVTRKAKAFGGRPATEDDLRRLYRHLRDSGFPLVDGFSDFRARLAASFEYRALVNAWVVLESPGCLLRR